MILVESSASSGLTEEPCSSVESPLFGVIKIRKYSDNPGIGATIRSKAGVAKVRFGTTGLQKTSSD